MTVDIANRLVQLRKEHHLSQEELAERLGLSRQAVSKWERAEASPDTDNLILLSRLYGVSIDELLRTDVADETIIASEQAAQNKHEAPQADTADKPRQRVHIGLKGVHVEDGDEYVHVGWDGIHVVDRKGEKVDVADGRVFVNDREYDYKKEARYRAPIAIIITMIYLFMGAFLNLWHPGWLIFLLIPILESLVTAVARHDPHRFAYPVLAAYVFLCVGFFWGWWHPTWMIFLTVPVFYAIFPARPANGAVTFGAVPDDLQDEFNGKHPDEF